MLVEEQVPCAKCSRGFHRMCAHPGPLARVGKSASEILACCDRKEFWTEYLYS
jgi:hypothetical protein